LDKLRDLVPDGEMSASRLVRGGGVRKFMETVKGRVRVDQKKIEGDARWDGLYGVCTNVEGAKPQELMATYRRLWRIEEVFRINKHTLKMRPIYHRLPRRVRAHVLLCFLSYTLLRWTQMKLAKGGLYFSSEELIKELHGVESFIIKDKIKKKGGEVYCVPRELTKRAQQIYSAFGKRFPTRPYRLQ